jgi:prepilin-type N-terminal cleavage/methylation domain-containing protein
VNETTSTGVGAATNERAHRSHRGFTLLELIVVLVVLGLLAVIAIPTYGHLISSSGSVAQQERDKAVANRVAAGIKLEPERATSDVDPANGVVDVFDDAFSETSEGAYTPGVSAAAGDWSVIVDDGPVYESQASGSGIVVGSGIVDGVQYLMTVSKYSTSTAFRCRISIDGAQSQCWTDDDATDFTLTSSLAGPDVEEYITPTRQAMLVVGGSSGALDDALVTNGFGTTYVSDDFNRADGPIGGLWSTFEEYAPAPNVSGDQLVSSNDGTNIAFFEAPDSTYEISARVAAMPAGADDSVAVQATVLSGGYAEGIFSVQNGQGYLLVSEPAAPHRYLRVAAPVTVNVGDVITLRRSSGTQLVWSLNGTELARFNRNTVGSLTGILVGSTSPQSCTVTSYFNDVTEATKEANDIAQVSPEADGSFSLPVTSALTVKVSAYCPDTGQYGVHGEPEVTALENAEIVTAIAGGTVDIGELLLSSSAQLSGNVLSYHVPFIDTTSLDLEGFLGAPGGCSAAHADVALAEPSAVTYSFASNPDYEAEYGVVSPWSTDTPVDNGDGTSSVSSSASFGSVIGLTLDHNTGEICWTNRAPDTFGLANQLQVPVVQATDGTSNTWVLWATDGGSDYGYWWGWGWNNS